MVQEEVAQMFWTNHTLSKPRAHLQSAILFLAKRVRGKRMPDTFTSWVICCPFIAYLSKVMLYCIML